VIGGTAADERRPVFRAPERVPEDARTLRATLERVLREREHLRLTPAQEEAARSAVRDLEGPAGGEPKTLQQAMMILFTIARSQGKP